MRRTTVLIMLCILMLGLFLLVCACGAQNLPTYSTDDRIQATCTFLATVTAR